MGPLAHKELQGMLDRGEVDESTEVWTESNPSWVPILETEHFNMSGLDVTPSEVVKGDVTYARETDDEALLPRPWVRLWARLLDYSLITLVLSFVFQLNFAHPLTYMFSFFIWIFVETFLMATWGSTPGKWMLKVMVRTKKGKKLKVRDSLNRAFSVWWLGMGIGLPVVVFITLIVASVKLSNTGMTSWDRRFSYRVMHGKIGALRIIITVIYFILFAWVINIL